MPAPCTVLIGSAELLPSLTERTGGDAGELLPFTDAEALRAFEAISERHPAVIAIEQDFAASSPGAALIRRIKADPALTQSEIRIVSPAADPAETIEGKQAEPLAPAAPPALDWRGARRAPRFPIADGVEVLVDGSLALLIDLSTIGAQVVSPTVLKPNQRVRMALSDEHSSVRFNAAVAWAVFEIPKNTPPRYRAGIEFLDADKAAVNAYLARHKQA